MKRNGQCASIRVAAAALLLATSSAGAQELLIVHEWGTITTQHEADGAPLGRLNRIDAADVLPDFVHRYEPVQSAEDPFSKSPGTPGRPDVTMRLETPVIYFYGRRGEAFDVR